MSPTLRTLRLPFVVIAALVMCGATTASAAPPPVQLRVGEKVQFIPELPEAGIAPHVLVPVSVKCDPELVQTINVFVTQPSVIFAHEGLESAPCTGRWEAIVVKADGEYVLGKATVDASNAFSATFPPGPVFVHRQIHIVP